MDFSYIDVLGSLLHRHMDHVPTYYYYYHYRDMDKVLALTFSQRVNNPSLSLST